MGKLIKSLNIESLLNANLNLLDLYPPKRKSYEYYMKRI